MRSHLLRTPALLALGLAHASLSSSSSPQVAVSLDDGHSHLLQRVRHETQRLVETQQARFFELWLGDWPACNDWTGAVLNQHLTAALASIARATQAHDVNAGEQQQQRLFAHSAAYYHAEDAFGIRQQAHDDMLWVVLGWLEALRLPALQCRGFWGAQYVPVFAHRARVFYEVVARAWNEDGLCGGGLSWNPRLEPYKNTITNTLYLTASVASYLHSPGDNNSAPFAFAAPHHPALLQAAVIAYDWLVAVRLQNHAGLYVDGYHSSPAARRNRSLDGSPRQCDERNEMVYSYNQGVLLSGLRQLWEATGNVTYLVDGHALVRAVIHATGWRQPVPGFALPRPLDDDDDDGVTAVLDQVVREFDGRSSFNSSGSAGQLGSRGILTEFCDPSGACSQDGQAFKGILFHHLTTFCTPLPERPSDPDIVAGISHLADRETATLHRRSCRHYASWVARNARAALGTRASDSGVVGGWWGSGVQGDEILTRTLDHSSVDVRNTISTFPAARRPPPSRVPDENDRGRGRTPETHSGGLAVVRCLLELLRVWHAD